MRMCVALRALSPRGSHCRRIASRTLCSSARHSDSAMQNAVTSRENGLSAITLATSRDMAPGKQRGSEGKSCLCLSLFQGKMASPLHVRVG